MVESAEMLKPKPVQSSQMLLGRFPLADALVLSLGGSSSTKASCGLAQLPESLTDPQLVPMSVCEVGKDWTIGSRAAINAVPAGVKRINAVTPIIATMSTTTRSFRFIG